MSSDRKIAKVSVIHEEEKNVLLLYLCDFLLFQKFQEVLIKVSDIRGFKTWSWAFGFRFENPKL